MAVPISGEKLTCLVAVLLFPPIGLSSLSGGGVPLGTLYISISIFRCVSISRNGLHTGDYLCPYVTELKSSSRSGS